MLGKIGHMLNQSLHEKPTYTHALPAPESKHSSLAERRQVHGEAKLAAQNGNPRVSQRSGTLTQRKHMKSTKFRHSTRTCETNTLFTLFKRFLEGGWRV